MLQRKFRIFCTACSILAVSAFVSCKGEGPVVTVCISDPAHNGFQCTDKNQKAFTLLYKDSENYIAVSPDDFEAVVDYCKLNRKPSP